jgi:hypothetical protein
MGFLDIFVFIFNYHINKNIDFTKIKNKNIHDKSKSHTNNTSYSGRNSQLLIYRSKMVQTFYEHCMHINDSNLFNPWKVPEILKNIKNILSRRLIYIHLFFLFIGIIAINI